MAFAKKAEDAKLLKKTPQIIDSVSELSWNTIRREIQWRYGNGPAKATENRWRNCSDKGSWSDDKSVSRILKNLGYSVTGQPQRKLHSVATVHFKKTCWEDLQFRHICRMREDFAQKRRTCYQHRYKKEGIIGNFKNAGRVWRDEPVMLLITIFFLCFGQMSHWDPWYWPNEGAVYIGLSHDTETIRRVDFHSAWWEQLRLCPLSSARSISFSAIWGAAQPSNAACISLWYALNQRTGWKSLCAIIQPELQNGIPLNTDFSRRFQKTGRLPLIDIKTVYNSYVPQKQKKDWEWPRRWIVRNILKEQIPAEL